MTNGLGSPLRSVVTDVVQRAFGTSCRVGSAEPLGGERPRSEVLRVWLTGGDAPRSVVVKHSKVSADSDPQLDRFHAELSALRLLDSLGDHHLAPQLVGDSPHVHVIVMTDLGSGPSLADLLQGGAPRAAATWMHAYAESLGRLGALTHARVGDLHDIRTGLGAQDGLMLWDRSVRSLNDELGQVLAGVGVPLNDGAAGELDEVRRQLCADPTWRTLTSGDPCPDNTVLGTNGRVAHFDFEFACARSALVDGTYLTMPFPTCWCANAIPPAQQDSLMRSYRAALADGVPAARDDDGFAGAVVAASAYWLVRSLVWHLPVASTADQVWGISTLRQRLVQRLSSFVHVARHHDLMPAFANAAEALHRLLRGAWVGLTPMPTYPGLRTPG